jgi:hypothetical protein
MQLVARKGRRRLERPILKTMHSEASPPEVIPVASAFRDAEGRDRDVVLSLLPVRGGLLPLVLGLAL